MANENMNIIGAGQDTARRVPKTWEKEWAGMPEFIQEKQEPYAKIIFRFESEKDLLDFYTIYKDTMVRNNAQTNFYYSLETFKNFVNGSGDLCIFSFIYDKNKAISVEMALISDDSIFSFLGGTLSESFDKRPNDFLKIGLINWARTHNIKYFVLGGGYGCEDGIFKYKKAS